MNQKINKWLLPYFQNLSRLIINNKQLLTGLYITVLQNVFPTDFIYTEWKIYNKVSKNGIKPFNKLFKLSTPLDL